MYDTSLNSLQLLSRGKVRDLYAIDDEHLLFIATDRLSAFDVVLPDPIPLKGKILTQISKQWLTMLKDIVPNHLTDIDPLSVVREDWERDQIRGRSMVVRRLNPLPVEIVVRGYLTGSAWREYQQQQSVNGLTLPFGFKHADKLPLPLFTPTTKAPVGQHDAPINNQQYIELIGDAQLAETIRTTAIEIFKKASEYANARQILIADTKFEFGTDDNGNLFLIDEVLTPDSSRFWSASQYRPGTIPHSYDKQFIRDYLEEYGWDKISPPPHLPFNVLIATSVRYHDALKALFGDSDDLV